jgi:hypothetical protein
MTQKKKSNRHSTEMFLTIKLSVCETASLAKEETMEILKVKLQ